MNAVLFFLIIVTGPFLFSGLVNRVKARWAGRRGAPILQSYYDFRKLLRKGEVLSKTVSFVFRASPSVQAAATIFAALLLPFPGLHPLLPGEGGFVLFAYALGLAKFAAVTAALDTGSSFEGMGAGREAAFSIFVEPSFFTLIGTLALITGETSFERIFALLGSNAAYTLLIKSLCALTLFIMLLVEGSRVPVDDPNTHLELTMIHEVMILDHSGPDLAFLQYAVQLKMLLITTLLADILVPVGFGRTVALLGYATVLILTGVAVGLVESLMARARMSHVPQFIFLMPALSLTAFAILMFFLMGGR